jgi:hypothetical protein
MLIVAAKINPCDGVFNDFAHVYGRFYTLKTCLKRESYPPGIHIGQIRISEAPQVVNAYYTEYIGYTHTGLYVRF